MKYKFGEAACPYSNQRQAAPHLSCRYEIGTSGVVLDDVALQGSSYGELLVRT